MKKIVQIFIVLIFHFSYSQQNCESYDINTGNWQTSAAGITISSNAPTFDGTSYMRGTDGASTTGSWIFNEDDYTGNLGANGGTCICWDYKVFDDSVNGGSPNMNPRIRIYQGTATNQTLWATFVATNVTITENSGWVSVCAAPILSSNTTLPSNVDGSWVMSSGSTIADWNTLISNIDGVTFHTDVAGSSTQNEVIGIDNFCVSNCCPSSISSGFTIDDYNCHDGVYDVTVTASDSVPSQWWRVYETSVEGQTGDSVTIGSASGTQGGTTTTFTNLNPDKFYYIKHGVWINGCFRWQETRTPLDRDCCIDNPQIEPYWDFCSSNNVCDLDTWPIRVVDENGNPVTGSDGVQFSWVSSNGGSSISDVVYTVAFEEWTLTLTYPDGCIYTRTYKKVCCEEDIHIEIDECPTEGEIATLEQQVQREKSQLSDEAYIKYINAIKNYKERTVNAKVKCDPCDNGTVVMRVVDANGNLITNFISITWGDGLFPNSNVRIGDVNVTYTVTVVVSVNGGQDRCIYTDTFIYECPCDLPAPTNVHLHVFTSATYLHWNAVPGAVGYIVSNSNVWNIGCNCRYPSSMRPIETTNNYTSLSLADGRCYMLRVAAICADGSISEYSEDICVGGGGKGSFGKRDITCTTSFVKKQIREVSVTPNPTKGEMTFNVTTNMDTEVTIAVYDTYGTLIKTFVQQVTSDDRSSISWDGSNLRKGIYFVNFKTKEETIYKQVIVK